MSSQGTQENSGVSQTVNSFTQSNQSNLLFYVAGPLTTGCVKDGIFDARTYEQNVRIAEEIWLGLVLKGHAAICVHSQARYMYGRVPEPLAIAQDLLILSRCDAVVVVPEWGSSKGTLNEMQFANAIGKAVLSPEQVDDWVTLHRAAP